MKYIRLALLPILLTPCTSIIVRAQESDPFSYASRLQPSAEAWQMSRHGEISPDLYTGAMAWSLPLYTYKDEDFTIPISLDYRFDGCRPSQPAGTVGMGWNLNCGGVITRQVVGLPDDYYKSTPIDSDPGTYITVVGFFFAANGSYVPEMSLGDSLETNAFMNNRRCIGQMSPLLIDIGNNALTSLLGTSPVVYQGFLENWLWAENPGTYFDPSSDIYHFSLPEVSGDFIILSDGRVKVFNCTDPEGEISVEILYKEDIYKSKITIHRKGYRYVFGGGICHLEFSFEVPTASHGINTAFEQTDPTRYCFSALHLNTISAPNNRTVTFCHSSDTIFASTKWKTPVKYKVQGSVNQPKQPYPSVVHSISRPLQSILVDGKTIVNYNYADKEHAEFGRNAFNNLPNWQYVNIRPWGQGADPDSLLWFNVANRLASVVIKNGIGEQVDSLSLSHHYTGAPDYHSSKMFLDSVSGNHGKYSFIYEYAEGSDAYPYLDATVLDHWGYWRSYDASFPETTTHRQRESLYDLPSNAREPDSTHTMHGALRQINYPSGGYSLINYECNRADRRVDINIDSDSSEGYCVYNYPNMLAGGVRVKSIINRAGRNGEYEGNITYDYCRSGLLMKMPRYYMDVYSDYSFRMWEYIGGHWDDSEGFGKNSVSTFNEMGLSFYETDGHIGYDTVHVCLDDGSFVEHRFLGYNEYPDEFYSVNSVFDGFVGDTCNKVVIGPFENHPNSIGYYLITELSEDTLNCNALLANLRICDLSPLRGRKASELTYSADSVLLRKTDYIWSADTASRAIGIYNIFSNFVSAQRSFIQSRLNSVITEEYLPNGGILSDTTSYVYNALGQRRIVERRGFDGSVRRSRFSYEHESDATAPPANVAAVATSRLYVDGNNRSEYLTSLRHFEYETDSALRHLPILSQEFCSKAPRFPVVNDGGIEWFAPKSTDDTLARRLSYNALQRPALLSLPGGAYVAFTWDASGRYPLSREDNGPAMVSSYEWKDMVGLTRKTGPTLRSQWYAYDSKWRLSEVRRADSVKITAYDYHLWCEDSTAGPSYTKQTTWRTSNKNNRDIVYYDGLGYPIQKVRTSTQTHWEHIVTPIRYDALRRDDARAFLPYEARYSTYNSADSVAQSQYYKLQFGNSEVYPYAEKVYGTSPAGRLLSSRQPGKDYADSSKVVTYDYRTNNAADSILDLTVTVSAQPQLRVGTAYLPAGRLLLTKTTDEDGCTSEVFTDASGKTVLSRQRTGGQRLDTYRVYDLRDSLVCVLQPEGAASIQRGSSHALLPPVARNDADTIPTIGTLLDNYAFLYAWDSWGRLAAKKRPGAAAEEFLSDDRGRVVLSRDGNLRNQGKWLYSEYDEYDALLRKSLITVNLGLDTLRQAARGQVDSIFTYPDTILMWPYYYRQDPEIFYYGRTASLAAGDSLFTPELDYIGDVESAGNDPSFGHYIVFEMERYYVGSSRDSIATGPVDTMVTNWPAILANAVTNSTLLEEHRYDRGDSPGIPQALDFMSVTGIVTAADTSSTRNLEVWQRQLMLPPGRTVPGDTTRYVERAFYYDVPGNLVQTVETNALGGISRTSTKYDYLGNVTVSEEKHTRAGSATADVKRTSYSYDNQGRMSTEYVSLNNTVFTGTEFDYDIFGHLTWTWGQGDEAEKALQEMYNFDIRGRLLTKEASRMIPYEPGPGGGDEEEEEEKEDSEWVPVSLFQSWLRYNNPQKQAGIRRWNGLISEIAHQRGDNGAIITNEYYYDGAGRLVDNLRYDGSSQTNKYTERDLSFDRNGNILTLKRFGTNVAAPQDNLAYTYEGNKLMQLNNATYQYDANGNMTHDGRRGLDLSWNHLNLPATISNDEDEDATVNYTYLSDGTKVLAQAPGTSEGYAYLGTMVYKLNNGGWTLETTPFTGGRFVRNTSGNFVEQRHITDHLGSTRTIVEGDDYTEVEQNDYYPFGKRIADNTLPTTPTNRWQFSGKEIQTLGSINLLDFGARLYDDYLGRWISQDPVSHKYIGITPYGYCNNDPVIYLDINGAEFTDSSKEFIRRIKDRIERMISTYDKKIERIKSKSSSENKSQKKRVSKLEEKKEQLQGVQTEIAVLESSNQVYDISINDSHNTASEVNSLTRYNVDNNQIEIVLGDNSMGMLAHELAHAYQFEIGEISFFASDKGFQLLYDKTDEKAAYTRGELFGGPRMNNKQYDSLPADPISINTEPHIKNNIGNPQALQSIANRANASYRVNGVTYYPQL